MAALEDPQQPLPPGPSRQRTPLPPIDEEARAKAPSGIPGECTDEICECSMHKCVSMPPRVPFEGTTTYRTEFAAKSIERGPQVGSAPAWAVIPDTRDFTTESRSQFGPKSLPGQAGLGGAAGVGGELGGVAAWTKIPESRDFSTESRAQFGPKSLPGHGGGATGGSAGAAAWAKIPESRDFTTESRSQFGPKSLQGGLHGAAGGGGGLDVAAAWAKIPESRDFSTESRSQFGPKALPERVEVATAGAAGYTTIPFEGTTTYRSEFYGKEVPRTSAAAAAAKWSAIPEGRDFSTEYRNSFLPHSVKGCPAALLPPAPPAQHPRQHMFWDVGARQWY